MSENLYSALTALEPKAALWERFFTVAPLVLIGTTDPDGSRDLAPKHMAFPLGWDDYFGFVCAPSHGTYMNVERNGTFTVTYPRPDAIVAASLSASPRQAHAKPIVGLLDTFPATHVDEVFAANGYLYLECRLDRIVDGFGRNALIAGKVVAAYVADEALRASDRDDADVILESPHLVYLYPGRFAVASESQAFPFPAGMRR